MMKIFKSLCNHRTRPLVHQITTRVVTMLVVHNLLSAAICVLLSALITGCDMANIHIAGDAEELGVFNISHPSVDVDEGFMTGLIYTVRVTLPKNTHSAIITVLTDSNNTGTISLADDTLTEATINTKSVIVNDVTSFGSVLLHWIAPSVTNNSESCVQFMLTSIDDGGVNNTVTSSPFCPYTGCYRVLSTRWATVNDSHSHQCVYIINTQDIYTIRVKFDWLEFDSTDEECVTSVSSSDQSHTYKQCTYNIHNFNNMSFVSDANYVVIRFKAQNTSNVFYVSFMYYSIDSTGQIACNFNLSSLNAKIKSFNYPYQYLPDLTCRTFIQVPNNYRIILTLYHVDIPLQNHTCDDFIQINQGSTISNRMCGSGDLGIWESHDNTMAVLFHSDATSSGGSGFVASYYAVPSCVNQYYSTDNFSHISPDIFHQSSNGSIQSVNYPENYLNNQDCDIIISCPRNNCIIHLLFHYINMHTPSNMLYGGLTGVQCTEDYIEVNDSISVQRFCGHWLENPVHVTSSTSYLQIHFHSDNSKTSRGYMAQWTTNQQQACPDGWITYLDTCLLFVNTLLNWMQAQHYCDTFYSSLVKVDGLKIQQFITTQLGNRLDNNYAVWIGANDRLHEGDFLWSDNSQVKYFNWFPGFHGYSHQPSDDGYSNEDCVELRNRFMTSSKEDQKINGYYWNDRNCLNNNTFICQRSTDPGVLASLVPREPIDDTCDKQYHVYPWQPTVTVASPYYPQSYSNNSDCTVSVWAPEGYTLTVTFRHFNLEPQSSCEFDRIQFHDSSDVTEDTNKLCGDWNNKLKLLTYVSRNNWLQMHFVTDHSVTSSGFSVDIKLTKALDVCDPGWLPVDNLCVYMGYPDTYEVAMDTCLLYGSELIHIDDVLDVIDSGATGNFTSFWTQASDDRVDWPSCSTAVYMHNTVYPQITDCQQTTAYLCQRYHNSIVSSITQLITDTSGVIMMSSPTYPMNTQITWTLAPPSGNMILLQLEALEMEHQVDCIHDSLVIGTEASHEMYRYCGNITNQDIQIHSNIAMVTLNSDWSHNTGYFKLYWQSVNTSICDKQIIYSQSNGTVQSLNYPYSYPTNQSCSYKIQAQSTNQRIHLKFKNISLDFGDKLTMKMQNILIDVLKNLKDYCTLNYMSYGNDVVLNYISDGQILSKGFLAHYQIVDNNKEDYHYLPVSVNDSFGVLRTINYPYSYPAYYKSTWKIHVAYGYNVYISDIHVKGDHMSQTCTDILIIKDPYSKAEVSINICDFDNIPANYTSYLNILIIRLDSNNNGLPLRSLQLRYQLKYDADFTNKTTDVDPGEIVLTECVSNETCNNRGVCVHTEGYQCQCTDIYTGVFCEQTFCDSVRCQHGGQCINKDRSWRCQCLHGYTGALCQSPIVECGVRRCSGHGRCDVIHPSKCNCYSGWAGSNCAVMAPLQSPGSSFGQRLLEEPFWIGIIVIGIVLFIAGLVLLIRRKCIKYIVKLPCCVKSKKKKKQDTKRTKGTHNTGFQFSGSDTSRTPSPWRHTNINRKIPTITVSKVQADSDDCDNTTPDLSVSNIEVNTSKNSHLSLPTEAPDTHHLAPPALQQKQTDNCVKPRLTAEDSSQLQSKRRLLKRQQSLDLMDSEMPVFSDSDHGDDIPQHDRQMVVDVHCDAEQIDVDQSSEVTILNENPPSVHYHASETSSSANYPTIPVSISYPTMPTSVSYPTMPTSDMNTLKLPITSVEEEINNILHEVEVNFFKRRKNSAQRRQDFAQSALKARKSRDGYDHSYPCSMSSNSSRESQPYSKDSRSYSLQNIYRSYDLTQGQDYCCQICEYKKQRRHRHKRKHGSHCHCKRNSSFRHHWKPHRLHRDYSTKSAYSLSSSYGSGHHRNPGDFYYPQKQPLHTSSSSNIDRQQFSSSGKSMSLTDCNSSRSVESRPSSICSKSSLYSLPSDRHKHHHHHHHHKGHCNHSSHRSHSKHSSKQSHDNVTLKNSTDKLTSKQSNESTTLNSLSTQDSIKDYTYDVTSEYTTMSSDSQVLLPSGNSQKSHSHSKAIEPLSKDNRTNYMKLSVPHGHNIKGLSPKSVSSDKSTATVSSGVFLDSSGDEMEITHNVIYDQSHDGENTYNTGKIVEDTGSRTYEISGRNITVGNASSVNRTRVSAKRPSVDSAYQSNEQSTEHYISKPNSSTVSPTSSNGFHWWKDADINIRSLVNVLGKRDDDHNNRVQNQLELAAHKLHMLKSEDVHHYTASDKIAPLEEIQMQTFSSSSPTESYLKLWLQQNNNTFNNQSKGLSSSKHRRIYPSRVLSMIKDEDQESIESTLIKSPLTLSKTPSSENSIKSPHRLSKTSSSDSLGNNRLSKTSSIDGPLKRRFQKASSFDSELKSKLPKTSSFDSPESLSKMDSFDEGNETVTSYVKLSLGEINMSSPYCYNSINYEKRAGIRNSENMLGKSFDSYKKKTKAVLKWKPCSLGDTSVPVEMSPNPSVISVNHGHVNGTMCQSSYGAIHDSSISDTHEEFSDAIHERSNADMQEILNGAIHDSSIGSTQGGSIGAMNYISFGEVNGAGQESSNNGSLLLSPNENAILPNGSIPGLYTNVINDVKIANHHLVNSDLACNISHDKVDINNTNCVLSKDLSNQTHIDNTDCVLSKDISNQIHIDNTEFVLSKDISNQTHIHNTDSVLSTDLSNQTHIDNTDSVLSRDLSNLTHIDNTDCVLSTDISNKTHLDNTDYVLSTDLSNQTHPYHQLNLDHKDSVLSRDPSNHSSIDLDSLSFVLLDGNNSPNHHEVLFIPEHYMDPPDDDKHLHDVINSPSDVETSNIFESADSVV